jgi:hypothetical protein
MKFYVSYSPHWHVNKPLVSGELNRTTMEVDVGVGFINAE